jgi:uncharacterized protein YbjQ (UPF0145 family)
MDSQQKYQIAYKKHYNERNYEVAYFLYEDIIKTYPNSKDAEYAQIQMKNIEEQRPNIIQEIELKDLNNVEIDKLQKSENKESNFLITTTNSIVGKEIESYIGLISDRIVVGAGWFSELFASFTDVFGGRSITFEDELTELNGQLMKSLIAKAKGLNADAVIGFKIDLDEISGKGFQMFVMSGVGTAVKLKNDKINGYIKESEKFSIADEIEKIVKLKESGKITEEELVKLKSKLI